MRRETILHERDPSRCLKIPGTRAERNHSLEVDSAVALAHCWLRVQLEMSLSGADLKRLYRLGGHTRWMFLRPPGFANARSHAKVLCDDKRHLRHCIKRFHLAQAQLCWPLFNMVNRHNTIFGGYVSVTLGMSVVRMRGLFNMRNSTCPSLYGKMPL